MLNFSINYYVFNQDITILNLVKKNIHCIKFFNIYIYFQSKKAVPWHSIESKEPVTSSVNSTKPHGSAYESNISTKYSYTT